MMGWLLVAVRVQLHAVIFRLEDLTCMGYLLGTGTHVCKCRCNNELKVAPLFSVA